MLVTNSHKDTPREYAEEVNNCAEISASQSLFSGYNFRNLASFLWQPFEYHASILRWEPPTKASGLCNEATSTFLSVCYLRPNGASTTEYDTPDKVDQDTALLPNDGGVNMVFMRGYPSPEWLNSIGAKFRIDPEFFQRHLNFSSQTANTLPSLTLIPPPPSVQTDTVTLHVTTICLRLSDGRVQLSQDSLDAARELASQDMAKYITSLSTLNSPRVTLGDSVVREFSIHDSEHFSIEQMVSINISQCGNGWLGTWMPQIICCEVGLY